MMILYPVIVYSTTAAKGFWQRYSVMRGGFEEKKKKQVAGGFEPRTTVFSAVSGPHVPIPISISALDKQHIDQHRSERDIG
jgi:hypothetical protein